MKSFVLALGLLSTAGVSAWERHLQMCPTPAANIACTMEFAPVKCGSMNCQYDNQCNANAAGFSPGVCWPADCVAPNPSIPCTADSNPVRCGDSACEYANYCNAEAAGFPPTVCEAVNCPTPAGNAPCPANYDPFVCLVEGTGLCRYDNDCLVTQAGLDPSGRCMRTQEYVNNVMGSCPAVGGDSVCPLVYEPVNCGGCYYVSETDQKMIFNSRNLHENYQFGKNGQTDVLSHNKILPIFN